MIAAPLRWEEVADTSARIVCENAIKAMRGQVADAEERYWALQNGWRMVQALDCDKENDSFPRFYPDAVVEKWEAAVAYTKDQIRTQLAAAVSGAKADEAIVNALEAFALSLRREQFPKEC